MAHVCLLLPSGAGDDPCSEMVVGFQKEWEVA